MYRLISKVAGGSLKIRLFNQRFILLLLLGIVLLTLPTVLVRAQSKEVSTPGLAIEIADNWRSHSGDQPGWASPDFDDLAWTDSNINQLWRAGAQGGYCWYRKEVRLPAELSGSQFSQRLGVQFGPLEYCAYQVYANGELIGSFGAAALPPGAPLPMARVMIFPIPARVITATGRLVLAVRIWQQAKYAKRALFYSAKHDSFQNQVTIGLSELLGNRVEIVHQHRLQADLIKFITAIFFLLVSLYHFQLYYGRRLLKEYLWFGHFSLMFAINIYCNSAWATEFIPKFFADAGKVTIRHLVIIPCIQFFWLLLSRPIKLWLRLAQVFQLLLALLVIVWPEIVLTPFNSLIFLTILPVIFYTIFITIQEARRGNPDALPITIGLGVVIAIEMVEVARAFGLLSVPLVAHWGFVALIISMAVTLSNRFNRVYRDLDILNQQLEHKVIERTEALASANTQLANTVSQLQQAQAESERKNLALDQKNFELHAKNEQLLASQQQADRIFSALAEALPGTVLDGKYRLEEKIGSGGYGAVFRATHLALNHTIAVKVFRPTQGNDSPEAIERFRLEAISACRVNHPNAVSVFDSGISSDGIAFIVMELLTGNSLKTEIFNRKTLSLKRCAEILKPICDLLSEAHAAGIIHRDIKPDNIFLHQSRQGEIVKVVDFGIAKLIGDQDEDRREDLTESGNIIGTPIYMAPERLKGVQYDGRADVYSVGIMLYEMLSGQKPFQISSKNVVEIIIKQLKEIPTPLKHHLPGIPSTIEAVVMAALEKNPALRPTARELSEWFTRAVSELSESAQQHWLIDNHQSDAHCKTVIARHPAAELATASVRLSTDEPQIVTVQIKS